MISTVSYPRQEISITAFLGTDDNVNSPLMSVTVPLMFFPSAEFPAVPPARPLLTMAEAPMTGPLSSVTMPDTMPSVWADANVDVIIRAAAIKVDKAFDSLVPISFSDIKSIIQVIAANIAFLHK